MAAFSLLGDLPPKYIASHPRTWYYHEGLMLHGDHSCSIWPVWAFRRPLSVASPLLISTHTAHSPFRDTSGSVTEFVCKHSPSSPSTHPFLLTSKLNPHNRDRWLPPNRVRHIVLKYQRSAGEYWCSSVCPCLRDQTPLAPTFSSLSLSLPHSRLTLFSQSVCFQSPGNWPKS